MLLEQFANDFPLFCKVGTGYNKKINLDAQGFIAVVESVHFLQHLEFESILVDEAHHPFPLHMPFGRNVFKFSATHKDQTDFKYTMGQAIEDGVLCDYDLTVPVTTQGHPYVSLAQLLLSQAGRFRRVLAYCNSVREARRFQQVLNSVGLSAWHINAKTTFLKRQEVLRQFMGDLQKPAHVLVTVQVLGEGVNIPDADTCIFVEPRNSYVSIIQALGRVLRTSAAKPLAHIVLPAVARTPGHSSLERPHATHAKNCSMCESLGVDQAARKQDSVRNILDEAKPSQAYAASSNRAGRGPICQNDGPPLSEEVPSDDAGGLGQPKRSNLDVACRTEPLAASLKSDEPARQRRHIRAAIRPKIQTDATLPLGYDTQLERFMDVISQADARLQHQPIHCRVSLVDATGTCAGDLRGMYRDLLAKLSVVLFHTDPWVVRLHALERFVSKHDRLPRRRSQMDNEASLGHFLHNAGCRLKVGTLRLDRARMLQKTSHTLISHRFRKWLDKDWYFQERCNALGRYVAGNKDLPRGGGHDSSAAALAKWLAGIGSANVHITRARLQTLQAVHPLVAERVEGWALKHYKKWHSSSWRQHAAATKELVCRAGRLPKGNGEERVLQRWLHKQKLVFFSLSDVIPEVKKELLIHPILVAYFHT